MKSHYVFEDSTYEDFIQISNLVYHDLIAKSFETEGFDQITFREIDAIIGVKHFNRETYQIVDKEKFMLAKIRFGF
jgi:hypothetical protein